MRSFRLSDVVVLVVLVVLVALAFGLRRSSKKTHVAEVESLTLTPADIALARRLSVRWSFAESGAPIVYDFAKPVRASLGTADYRRAMQAAEVMMHVAELGPGHYEFDSPLEAAELAREPFVEHRRAEVSGSHVGIDVSPAHLELLRAANTRVVDEGEREIGVAIDPKRPYGDMTYFELDMGAILGEPPLGPPRRDAPRYRDFTPQQLARFEELHEQLEPVLQVFLQRATFVPGDFIRGRDGHWKRLPE